MITSLGRFAALLGTVTACGEPQRPPAAPPPVVVAAPAAEDLTAAVEAVRAAEKLPAVGVAIWKHGTLVAKGVSGVRAAGDPTPVTFDDQWHLGSDTKAMTAALIGIYVDRGVLHWTDTLATLFSGETIDPGYANVTLDQVLQHRSGAPGKPPDALWAALWRNAPDARIAFVRGILAQPPAQAPGTFVYSNAGYMIAGAALERATKQTWETLIARDLFAPLHMRSCGFGAPGTATAVDQPRGHTADGTAVPPGPKADNPPALGPAGTVHCSLADWGAFLSFEAAPATPLVTAATRTHLHTPPPDGNPDQAYMGGWLIVRLTPGDTRYIHEGSNTMWHAIGLVVPALDMAVAVVANQDDNNLLTAIAPVVSPFLKR
ncbi:MAG: serine hydrolase domain-containing protein [Kofleriaceae bacterium]